MPTDTRTSELVLNMLSKLQYDNIPNPDPNQLYLVPEDEEHKPICYPTTATNIEPSTSKLLLTSSVNDNGTIITQCGFVWNTIGTPTISDNIISVNPARSGVITSELQCSVVGNHYFRSFATNANGTTYGDILTYNVGVLILDTLSDMWMLKPLPSNYTRLKYVEFKSDIGFDLGIYFGSSYSPETLRIKCQFKIEENTTTYQYIYGRYVDSNTKALYLVTGALLNSRFIVKSCGTIESDIFLGSKFGTKVETLQTYDKFYINNVEVVSAFNHSGNNTNLSICLGKTVGANTIGFKGKIYLFYADNTYINQKCYIPCINTDGRVCFYEIINNNIFTKGTGDEPVQTSEVIEEGILLTGTTAHIVESNQDYTYNGTTWVLNT